jgi:hypothetical protein
MQSALQQRKDPAALFIAAPLSVIAALGFPSGMSETQLLVPESAAMVYGHAPYATVACIPYSSSSIAYLSIGYRVESHQAFKLGTLLPASLRRGSHDFLSFPANRSAL